jgi:hypothetical protein
MTIARRFFAPAGCRRASASTIIARVLFAVAIALPAAALACSGGLHIEVQEAGVYALDYAAVVAHQPGLGDCRSDALALRHLGADVPIRIVGDREGRFGPGARIEWVGQMLHGPQSWFDPYSTVNVYQLGAGDGQHARMKESQPAVSGGAVALQRSAHFEQENLMLRLSDREMKPGDEPDVWQWAKLTPIDAQPFTWNFDLADLDTRSPFRPGTSATLVLDFRGASSVIETDDQHKVADHVVAVSINGNALATQTWEGRDETRREVSVPVAWLKDKNNVVSLSVPTRHVPGDGSDNFIVDVVMFNWFAVSYPAFGDVAAPGALRATADGTAELHQTGGGAPQLYALDGTHAVAISAGGGRYRAPIRAGVDSFAIADGTARAPAAVRAIVEEGLRDAAPGYDYVIVTHPRLAEAIQPLARYHRDHGHRVIVADINAVYDEFNGGITHPSAIRDLIAAGVEHWQTKPHYLLLVGDASNDVHHDVRSERLNAGSSAIHPHLATDEAMLPGALSNMPTTSYAQWAADLPNRNLIPTWQFPSIEGQAASDNGYAALKNGDFHPRLAVGRIPVVEPAEVQAVVDKTIAYMSHPTPGNWRRELTFISTDEVASFKTASDKMAVELGGEGYAIRNVYTKQDAADAAAAHAELKNDLDAGNLLVHFLGHGGAFIWRVGPPADLFTLDDVSALTNVGRYPMVLAMTCFSAPFDNPTEDSIGERFLREKDKGAVAVFAASWTNSPNPQYSKTLIAELLKPDNTIGDAIVAAKKTVTDRTFVEMYNLLGDPAIVLNRPRGRLRFMRDGDRWNPQIVVNVPETGFAGGVDVDWVDKAGATLASRHFESRDERFALAAPDPKATEVRVHAWNPRSGYSAFGALALAEPPPPVVATAKPTSRPRPPAKAAPPKAPSAAPATTSAMPVVVPARDRLTHNGFESGGGEATMATANPHGTISEHRVSVGP